VTSDRVSSGGLNAGSAPRIGAFLGSTMQSHFRVGDVNVTDPRGTGSPLLFPELLFWMIGSTRPRVNCFMNKFRKLGFIEYNGGLKINRSLLSVVLHE
jgi:hypothetical protein